MKSRKRVIWITGIVVAIGLIVVVITILLRPPEYPSITLSDGRIFSFAGVTVGAEPYLYLERTPVSRVLWKPVAYLFPNSQAFFRKYGLNPPWFLVPGGMGVKNDDVFFWMLSRSSDGRNSSSGSISPEGIILNGIHIKLLDSETKQNITSNGSGGHNPDDNRSFTFVYIRGLRKVTTKVDVILSRENDQGVMENLTTWTIDIP